jgi:hypothetical protein
VRGCRCRRSERGIARGKGGPYALPITGQLETLAEAIRAHARWSQTNRRGRPPDTPIEGDDLTDWVEAVAEEFAAWLGAQPDEQARFYSAFGPKGFLRWLNETARKREARRIG